MKQGLPSKVSFSSNIIHYYLLSYRTIEHYLILPLQDSMSQTDPRIIIFLNHCNPFLSKSNHLNHSQYIQNSYSYSSFIQNNSIHIPFLLSIPLQIRTRSIALSRVAIYNLILYFKSSNNSWWLRYMWYQQIQCEVTNAIVQMEKYQEKKTITSFHPVKPIY